ncbi:hypothetical protein A8V01_13775 [Novosphingobium guangzhouense]|uniref:Uncharacterized protein n=1 Tax=Novosphingobium guangzhouense TaxID=1850347 RepID=A0A2K2G4B2_9SPHN|nr:hypothetical protein A8V01_13775 [Novosphingobium guangzhouense]
MPAKKYLLARRPLAKQFRLAMPRPTSIAPLFVNMLVAPAPIFVQICMDLCHRRISKDSAR